MNVPKLRFPGFSGEWEENMLGDIAKINPRTNSLPEIFIYIDLESVKDGILLKEDKIYKDNAPSRAQRLLNKDDILFQMVRPYQKNNYFFQLEGDYVASTGYAQIRTDQVAIFLSQLLLTEKFVNNVLVRSTGTSYPAINSTDLSRIKINLPSKPEQQKIATFLTSVDTKIEQLTKKKTLLEQYKKGVMQKIFSQEIRFKADDGGDFPDWVEKRLGDVFYNQGGTALEKYTSSETGYYFISIGNYSKYGKYIDNKQRIVLNDKTKTKLLDKDNLVMVLNDKTATGDIIGSTILIEKNDRYIYNQRSERLICKHIITPLYAWHYLNSNKFRKKVFSISQGGTQIYVNFSSVKRLLLALPSKNEQTKIANFLSSIDTKIEQVGKQLNSTKEFKKALLQQMFV